jgi:RNA polymerase sigma-70 factor (ECF subfamily)
MDETEAIARLKRGDIRGLEILVRKYQLDAVHIAAPIINDLGQAEEIVQEAFIKVYQNIEKFDETRSFRSWFLQIVVNDTLNLVRRQSRLVPLNYPEDTENDVLQDENENCLLRFEQAEFSDEYALANAVQKLLESLSPEHQAIIQLKFYLSMSEKEIADVVQVPIGTVKSRLYAAKNIFKSMLIRQEIFC